MAILSWIVGGLGYERFGAFIKHLYPPPRRVRTILHPISVADTNTPRHLRGTRKAVPATLESRAYKARLSETKNLLIKLEVLKKVLMFITHPKLETDVQYTSQWGEQMHWSTGGFFNSFYKFITHM